MISLFDLNGLSIYNLRYFNFFIVMAFHRAAEQICTDKKTSLYLLSLRRAGHEMGYLNISGYYMSHT